MSTFERATVDGPDVTCSYAVYLMRCLEVALPFGSRSAVNAFIRCARFLQWTSARVFIPPLPVILMTLYPSPRPACATIRGQLYARCLTFLIRRMTVPVLKCDDFSKSVSALGALFDWSETGVGTLKVRNTDKRVEDTTLF